ncbi:MAG TPA: aminopeptidase P family N-terminal domain-containing protein, partial [Candidatus Limnocylindrales bacterium]
MARHRIRDLAVVTLGTRPAIPAERHAERLRRLAELAADRGLDGVVIGVGPDLDYLTGYRAMPLERLTALAIGGGSRGPTLVVPRLELAAAEAGIRPSLEIQTWEET